MAEETQHQALYRRYRPQTPPEVLGQDHVVRALTGAIRENRLHHAFLFCGPRGTGKTSTARILAKMVNCEQGPTAEPCGVCRQCVAIREGTHLDVVEIDAASHGGRRGRPRTARAGAHRPGDGPREGLHHRRGAAAHRARVRRPPEALRGAAARRPVRPGHHRAAEDAGHHRGAHAAVRLPPVLRWRRSPQQLQAIAAAEGVTLTDSAAHVIARQAEGSSRDALSILDQASVLGGSESRRRRRHHAAGRAPREEVQHELADAVAVGDAKTIFELVNRLVQDGRDLRTVTSEALGHFRNLLIAKTAPGQADLLDVPADVYERLRIQAEKFTPGELARVIGAPAGRPERHAVDHVAADLAGAGAGARHPPGHRPQPRRHRGAPRTPGTPRRPRSHQRHARRRCRPQGRVARR